jgi:hypothetical protein
MSIRYKQALLSLLSMIAIYGWYFARALADGANGFTHAVRLTGMVGLLALVQIIGNIVIAGTSSDRYAAMDERELHFDRRATQLGYYVLISGAVLAAASIHFAASSATIANLVLVAIVLGEVSRQAVFLFLHHRAA